MNVTTLRPHGNAYGKKYEKAVDDAYDHPSPQGLIEEKIVELASAANAKKATDDKK
jgi:hypothetical protein